MKFRKYTIIFFVSILSLMPLISYGQDIAENESSQNENSWIVGVTFIPSYSYRVLQAVDPSLIETRNNLETPTFGFSVGLNSSFILDSQSEIEFGALFSREVLGYEDLSFTDMLGAPEGDLELRMNYDYLVLPIRYRRYISQGPRVKLFGNVGLSLKYFLTDQQQADFFFFNGEVDRMRFDDTLMFPNQLNANFLIGFGAQFQLRDNIVTAINPTFRYGLFSVEDDNNPVAQHNFSIGMALNLGYSF